ncbi:MAG TPA: BTAD domain-containing putative transcriptional regulator [Pyrinomonadaceae bacterium]|nr:BTAD domain-containing putative transcriptional regulator [Pyrinomonadaceae bacterium]
MPGLRFRLFGKFSAHLDTETVPGLDAGKDQELLSYLLIHRDRPHSREALASLLWGNTSTEKSKKYLRQALWHLHGALNTQNGNAEVLKVDHDWLSLNPSSDLWTDVADFERAFAGAEGIPGKQLDSQQAEALKNAAALYNDDLLPGWYQDWILFERERLQNMYLLILDKLIGYLQYHQQYEVAQGYGTTILKYDPARERTHRQLMHLYYLGGDRTAALRQFERCASALKQELGVKPERRTIELYERIKSDQLATNDFSDTSIPREALSPDIVNRLKQLQTILAGVQRRIQRDIKAVEATKGHTKS